MENEIMKKYYEYMKNSSMLRTGVYEAEQLAKECGIAVSVLIFLGARVNASQVPISIKDGWYIYGLEECIVNGKLGYKITIDKSFKLL